MRRSWGRPAATRLPRSTWRRCACACPTARPWPTWCSGRSCWRSRCARRRGCPCDCALLAGFQGGCSTAHTEQRCFLAHPPLPVPACFNWHQRLGTLTEASPAFPGKRLNFRPVLVPPRTGAPAANALLTAHERGWADALAFASASPDSCAALRSGCATVRGRAGRSTAGVVRLLRGDQAPEAAHAGPVAPPLAVRRVRPLPPPPPPPPFGLRYQD